MCRKFGLEVKPVRNRQKMKIWRYNFRLFKRVQRLRRANRKMGGNEKVFPKNELYTFKDENIGIDGNIKDKKYRNIGEISISIKF